MQHSTAVPVSVDRYHGFDDSTFPFPFLVGADTRTRSRNVQQSSNDNDLDLATRRTLVDMHVRYVSMYPFMCRVGIFPGRPPAKLVQCTSIQAIASRTFER